MAAPPLSDAAAREAITAVAKHGTIRAAALALNLPYMTLKNRLDTAERRGLALDAPLAVPTRGAEQCPMTLEWPVLDGVFAAFSDAHWTRVTQARSVAHEALLRALPDIKPDYLLSGGDLMDFGGIGRHDPIGWENRPKVREEIEAAQRHLSDMRDLAPSAMCFWTRGNHDDRLESFLARHADPMRGMEQRGQGRREHYNRPHARARGAAVPGFARKALRRATRHAWRSELALLRLRQGAASAVDAGLGCADRAQRQAAGAGTVRGR
jgi:hypothetical protein